MTFITAVVPVFNSAPTLASLVERLEATLAPLGDAEIVLVDDGSSDGSWGRICELAETHASVRGIAFRRNFGQHNAVLAGVRAARGSVIVTLDDDLQHPPEEIPKLLAGLKDCDVVYGRARRERHGRWRNGASRATKWMLRALVGWREAPDVSDFRVFRTELRDGFATVEAPAVSFDAMLSWVTSSVCTVTVEHSPRQHGSSNYRLGSLFEYGVTMATGYTTFPLRLAAVAGALLTLAGAVLAGVAIATSSGQRAATGGLLVASAVAFVAGLQLVSIGIVGEYLGRIYLRAMGRPQYVIRERTATVAAPSVSAAPPLSQRRSNP